MKLQIKPFIAMVLIWALVVGCSNSMKKGVKISENFEDAAANFEKGLKGFDPFKLGQLLEKNEVLKKQLEEIQSKLNYSIGRSGAIQLNNRPIKLKVASYLGSWKINSYLNDRKNKIWRDVRLSDTDNKLIIDSDKFLNELYKKKVIFKLSDNTIINSEKLSNHINDLFLARQREYIYPIAVKEITLQEQLGHTNQIQMIGLNLTPVGANEAGKWEITLQLEIQNSSGGFDVLKVYNFSSDFNKEHHIGKDLPEENIIFFING